MKTMSKLEGMARKNAKEMQKRIEQKNSEKSLSLKEKCELAIKEMRESDNQQKEKNYGKNN